MNYLAHWRYARKPIETPEYCLGLIWPDLARSKPEGLIDGIDEHNALDRRFHTCGWFTAGMRQMGAKHASELACHVALELAIDRHLVHTIPQLIGRAEELLCAPSVAPVLAGHDYAARMVGKIVEGRLHMYGALDGCHAVLESVMKRVHSTQQCMQGIMVDAAAIVDASYDSLESELLERKP